MDETLTHYFSHVKLWRLAQSIVCSRCHHPNTTFLTRRRLRTSAVGGPMETDSCAAYAMTSMANLDVPTTVGTSSLLHSKAGLPRAWQRSNRSTGRGMGGLYQLYPNVALITVASYSRTSGATYFYSRGFDCRVNQAQVRE